MSKKCRKWPFASLCPRKIRHFFKFSNFSLYVKITQFKEFTANAFNCSFLIDKYVSRYIIKTNDVNL